MAATITGSVTPVQFDYNTATPAGVSVTIPSDATAAYLFWSWGGSTAGAGLVSATLNSVSPSESFSITRGQVTADVGPVGVLAWYAPATGSRTVVVQWSEASADGPSAFFVFTKDGTSAWRDADATQSANADALSVTLTTQAGDLVLKMHVNAGSGVPGLSSGWTNGADQGFSFATEYGALSYVSASGASQVCQGETTRFYSRVVAVAIVAASGGAAVKTMHLHRQMRN